MAMPHPGMFMIPFGCVVIQSQNTKGFSLDIYRDASKIVNLHGAFANPCVGSTASNLANTIVTIKDDTNATTMSDSCSVILYDDLTLNHPNRWTYWTWRVNSSVTIPQQVKPAPTTVGPKIVLKSGWHYFILPISMKPYGARQELKEKRRDRR
jgi:hypothetical protein